MNIWDELCNLDNLELAYKKARKGKASKRYIIEFEKDFYTNLSILRFELMFNFYQPKPLKTFVIKDPKTRIISKSDFRDRIVHHAICNLIEPTFDKSFIFDSYANRKGKGTLKAIQRFEQFKRKVSKNNSKSCLVLKADIKHYFENINRGILLMQIKNKIQNPNLLRLIQLILNNHQHKKGMPLGNLTSQFFANIYLDKLDQYVKHKLKVRYYIRYVDDFIIFDNSKQKLESLMININHFLIKYLEIELHSAKSKVIPINNGIQFLGYRIFPNHKLLKKPNLRKFYCRLFEQINLYKNNLLNFDKIYNSYLGWQGYAQQANTYFLRKDISQELEKHFFNEVSTSQINSKS